MLKKHILILEFIGKDMKPAPKLKDVKFPQDDDNALLISAYHQTIDVSFQFQFNFCRVLSTPFSKRT